MEKNKKTLRRGSGQACSWPGDDPLMVKYHDEEWGVPVTDDKKIFEFLVLESAQAGLSWRTILHKRGGYYRYFDGFNPEEVAHFSEKRIAALLTRPEIIRNRLKIEAAVNNAKRFLEVQKEFATAVGGVPSEGGSSFSKYMWQFVGGEQIDGKRKTMKDIPAITPQAEAFAKDLKKRGFKFMGPTVVYAHMQAVGMVNDHVIDCFRYKEVPK